MWYCHFSQILDFTNKTWLFLFHQGSSDVGPKRRYHIRNWPHFYLHARTGPCEYFNERYPPNIYQSDPQTSTIAVSGGGGLVVTNFVSLCGDKTIRVDHYHHSCGQQLPITLNSHSLSWKTSHYYGHGITLCSNFNVQFGSH